MKKSNIYLAGSFDSREKIKEIATILRGLEHNVYCPFELKIENAWDYSQEDWGKMVFDFDIDALDKCDVFLLITPGRRSSSGMNWEQGYVYCFKKFVSNKTIIVLQYTDNETSLMTFNGCDIFVNSSEDNLISDIKKIFGEENENQYSNKKNCTTHLT